MNFPNLIKFNFFNNKLTSLQALPCGSSVARCAPDNMNFPNLQDFDCSKNQLIFIPDMNFPNLKEFCCSYNKLTSLPECILNFKNLHHNNNEIDLSLQIKKNKRRIKREKKRREIKLLAQPDANNV